MLERIRGWRGHKPARHGGSAGSRAPVMVALDSAAHTWLFRVARNRAAIADFCTLIERRLPPEYASLDILRAFQVAFDELLTNVVTHAREGGEEPIEVLLKREPTRVQALVRYRGAPFDPTQAPTPDTAAGVAERPIGGLGVHLVRTLMDDFRHAYVAGYNELTLGKRC